MARLKDMTLDDLYNRPKITKTVLDNIIAKEDFAKINPRYCEAACLLKCNNRESVYTDHRPVDIIILQSHDAPPDKWKSSERLERNYGEIIAFLAKKHFPDASWRRVNVLKCAVDESNLEGKKELTQTKITRCSPYALEEIRKSGAKVIISLTTPATKAVGLEKYSNYSNRGEIHISPTLDIPVVVTLHPKVTTMIRQNASGQMWGPDYFGALERDFAKAGRLVRGELTLKDLNESIKEVAEQITVCRDIDEVRHWVNHIMSLPSGTVISWDLETRSLCPWHPQAKILTTQFGYRRPDGKIHAVVIPLWHRANKFYNPDIAWKILEPLLTRGPKKVGHNIKFDIKYTAVTTGVRATNIAFDTMLLLHDINSGLLRNFGLKRAVWDWIPESGLGGYEDLLEEAQKAKFKAEKEAEKAREKELERERRAAEKAALAEDKTEKPKRKSRKKVERDVGKAVLAAIGVAVGTEVTDD